MRRISRDADIQVRWLVRHRTVHDWLNEEPHALIRSVRARRSTAIIARLVDFTVGEAVTGSAWTEHMMESALHAAVSSHCAPEVITLLVKRGGANPSSPLHLAAALGNAATVRALLEAGASAAAKDMYGLDPRQVAVLSRNASDEVLDMLSVAGCTSSEDTTPSSTSTWTPLMLLTVRTALMPAVSETRMTSSQTDKMLKNLLVCRRNGP